MAAHVPAADYLGMTVAVTIDRPIGSKHPEFGYEYPLNYGFVPGTVSGDGEELDAYVMGVDEPLSEFLGRCVAVIHRLNDEDDKLILAPDGYSPGDAEIEDAVRFQEKWFEHELIR
jgi:inorganic pyrophosphatase